MLAFTFIWTIYASLRFNKNDFISNRGKMKDELLLAFFLSSILRISFFILTSSSISTVSLEIIKIILFLTLKNLSVTIIIIIF